MIPDDHTESCYCEKVTYFPPIYFYSTFFLFYHFLPLITKKQNRKKILIYSIIAFQMSAVTLQRKLILIEFYASATSICHHQIIFTVVSCIKSSNQWAI